MSRAAALIASGEPSEEDVVNILINEPLETLPTLLGAVTKQTLPVKSILSSFLAHVHTLPNAQRLPIYESLVETFTPPTALISDALTDAALHLAEIFEGREMFGRALETLHILQTDVVTHDFADEAALDAFRVQLNTRIARDCLEIGDCATAEAHLTRISPLLNGLADQTLAIEAQRTAVRVMVRVGRWLEAASKLLLLDDPSSYCELVLYALLASTTPFKGSLLEKINARGDILSSIENTALLPVFLKMHDHRLLYESEHHKLLEYATQHNRQGLEDGYWADELTRSIVENNLVAASRVFANITLQTFTEMLGLEKSSVESLAAEMIRSDRLSASIDDITKTVQFTEAKPLEQWQDHVADSCAMLDRIAEDIAFT